MSLINDALKRASEAQQQAPPPSSPGPQFRPVEPGPRLSRFGLLLPLPGRRGPPRAVFRLGSAAKERFSKNGRSQNASRNWRRRRTNRAPTAPA